MTERLPRQERAFVATPSEPHQPLHMLCGSSLWPQQNGLGGRLSPDCPPNVGWLGPNPSDWTVTPTSRNCPPCLWASVLLWSTMTLSRAVSGWKGGNTLDHQNEKHHVSVTWQTIVYRIWNAGDRTRKDPKTNSQGILHMPSGSIEDFTEISNTDMREVTHERDELTKLTTAAATSTVLPAMAELIFPELNLSELATDRVCDVAVAWSLTLPPARQQAHHLRWGFPSLSHSFPNKKGSILWVIF